MQHQIIMDAIKDFHEYTCVRFVPYNGEKAHIRITPGEDHCHSIVGYSGSNYNVNLETACFKKGTLLHELMHVLGFFHEHSRPDRDNYVTIQWDNIENGQEINFDKMKNHYMNNFGLPYDFGSIMHYSNDSFSSNGGETIIPKVDPNVEMGQSDSLSSYDIAKINRIYKC